MAQISPRIFSPTRLAAWLLLLASLPTAGSAQSVLSAFPDRPDAKLRYIVYLHGRIVEDQGRQAVSPDFGAYQFDDIVAALAAHPGTAVIGEVRAKGTDADQAAAHVVEGVRGLLAAGVPARNVTVVGASKGALIAKLASASLENREVGWVIMAGCSGSVEDEALHGRVLSIYEASDEMGQTCAALFAKSPDLASHDEVKIKTGLKHGFLYKPLPEWLRPATAWIQGRKIDR